MKRHAPATGRNREPIAAVLSEELPLAGTVLEIASGSGEHAVHFARRFPDHRWQPSDPDPQALASIAAWREESGLANLAQPVELDASSQHWPLDRADAIVCINMVHISPLGATEGLLDGADRLLSAGAPLILYGPYLEEGVPTASSNLEFDRDLRSRNPQWGLRDTAWLDGRAAERGLTRTRRVAMPANNIVLVYRKT